MKKLLIWLSLVIIIVILFFSWFQYKSESKIAAIDTNHIKITALPSPPNIKTIDKKADIEKIISFINSINKKVTMPSSAKGWEFYIQTKGNKDHYIYFVGNRMKIDWVWYKISIDEIKTLREIYKGSDYKEEPYI
jgi:hypothetical protein